MMRWAAASVIGVLVLFGVGQAREVASSNPVSTAAVPAASAPGFGSDWPVYHHDGLGTGIDATGTDLSSAARAWTSRTLDGKIYGEPLVEAGRVVVATENNTVYALAANTGAIVWATHIATPVSSSSLSCGDIGPVVGITSTPVIDPVRGEVFVVDDELAGTRGAAHHLVGIDLFSGVIQLDTPVDPPGSSALDQLQRPGLALDAGKVLIGFGGNDGDCGNYHGWLVAEPETGGPLQTFEVAKVSPDSKGAIWMGGAAPIVDGAGNIWVSTGNSTATGGTYDNSDGVLELNSNLTLKQAFAPSNWGSQNAGDQDLGSASPALMSDGLLFQAGKSQIAYVMSQASLRGVGGQLAEQSPYCGGDVDGGAAISGQVVYTPCQRGVIRTQVTPGSPPRVSTVWQTSTGAGGPPVLVAGASGLLWTIDQGTGSIMGLNPATGVAAQTISLGSIANHFPTPSVADGLLLAAVSTTVQAFDGPNGLPPPPLPEERPGLARDVGVGADGSVWVVGTDPTVGGFGIYRWNGSGWIKVPGGAERIAVDPGGNPWVVNAAHRIYHWNGSGWALLTGAANDVGAGANGSAWVVGTDPMAGGFGIYHWSGSGWIKGTGSAEQIAVDPSGNPWLADSGLHIFSN